MVALNVITFRTQCKRHDWHDAELRGAIEICCVVSMVLAAAGVVVAKRAQSAMSVLCLIRRMVTRCARRVCATLLSTSPLAISLIVLSAIVLELGNAVTFAPGCWF